MKSSQTLTLALGAFVFGSCVMPAEDAAHWPDVVETISPGRLQRVMEYGVDLEAYSEWGLTALEVAVWNGRPLEIVQDLLEAGADLEVRGINEAGLVQGAVEGYRRAAAEPIDLLLRYGCALQAQDSYGNTAWWVALEKGDVSALHVLDAWDASAYSRNTKLRNYWNGRGFNLQSAYYLLDEMKRRNPAGWMNEVPLALILPNDGLAGIMSDGSAYFWAYQRGEMEILQHLLGMGFHVNLQTRNGNALLHLACKAWGTQDGIVPYLLQHGADPNLANNDGNRPLQSFMQREYRGDDWQIDLDALLDAGAVPNAAVDTKPSSKARFKE